MFINELHAIFVVGQLAELLSAHVLRRTIWFNSYCRPACL